MHTRLRNQKNAEPRSTAKAQQEKKRYATAPSRGQTLIRADPRWEYSQVPWPFQAEEARHRH
ncbi:hypothetical protein DLM45_03445 [Hyphomicrobium methylovorum]|nr:hypothetical protein [Hyphomicrobium methylovorum]